MKNSNNTVMTARKVAHQYFVENTFKAGMMLKGWMIKSIRAGHINASGIPYISITNGEVFLHGLTITPLQNTDMSHKIETDAPIKLLLQRKEINKLAGLQQQQGYTLVVRKVFWDGKYLKAEVCVAKGKKLHDKRSSIKERDTQRQTRRALKQYG